MKKSKRSKLTPAKKPLDFISSCTGKDRGWWVLFIQSRISFHTKKTKNPWHGRTDSAKVVADLVRELSRRSKMRGDENMAMAIMVSYTLALWYLRVHRAKSYDPRRPVQLRKGAYWNRHAYAKALFEAIMDESEDQKYFPGQRWETPFDPYPTDGFYT